MLKQSEQPINFSEKHLQAFWLTNAKNRHLVKRTIVINLGHQDATILVTPEKYLRPRSSTILKEVAISGDSLLLIEVTDAINIGGIILEDAWHQLGELTAYPKNIPLWKSPQYDLGIVEFDPFFVTALSAKPQNERFRRYQVKVNLWFSPANTNCVIHNHHMTPEFLEVHTQIYGLGRMQKFHSNDLSTLYQDVILGVGETHIPFASVNADGSFNYPWHQYYSDTDCIWLANEFHPID